MSVCLQNTQNTASLWFRLRRVRTYVLLSMHMASLNLTFMLWKFKRRNYESTERGLLCDALGQALRRQRGLDLISDRHRLLAPTNPQDAVWKPLQRLIGPLSGTVKNHTDLRWREGIAVRLDWADGRLWLLIEPRTVFEGITDDNKKATAVFSRERTVRRYNHRINQLIDFWTRHLSGDDDEIRALDVGGGN